MCSESSKEASCTFLFCPAWYLQVNRQMDLHINTILERHNLSSHLQHLHPCSLPTSRVLDPYRFSPLSWCTFDPSPILLYWTQKFSLGWHKLVRLYVVVDSCSPSPEALSHKVARLMQAQTGSSFISRGVRYAKSIEPQCMGSCTAQQCCREVISFDLCRYPKVVVFCPK
jgi:hypothetical protein